MADGKEDLAEKNKEKPPASPKFSGWKHFQGREDAEMLQEKSAGWSSTRANRGDYDCDDD
ncbi:MAG: hypothetical protein II187_01665 [Treponema sp.]|nr:hypothetical protein [Treponema sp.]